MKIAILTLGALCIAAALSGCVSTSRVYEVSPGTYAVTTTGDGFTTASRTFDHAFTGAQSFCEKQGKHLEVVNQDEHKTRMDIDTTISLLFHCT